ncbi:hypothetical protein KFK09_009868 [Dendrobium nobile]|uniref:Uncharacterized protein n=1 Tax=Dendrobium nobile TaxID=94219 RepID=A0A8T3BIA3_DENNO|nr:hypothetical protein KFK09_009868 [Dendrobium nobile]
MTPTSVSQRTDSSYAFLSKPLLRLAKVTCRLFEFSIRLNSVFALPITPYLFPYPNRKAKNLNKNQNMK